MKTKQKELKVSLWEDTRTVELMDTFEGIEGNVRYDRLVFYNRVITHGCYCDMVVERADATTSFEGDITITQLKKRESDNYIDLVEYINEQVSDDIVKEYKGKNKVFYFENPFLLRAQNSYNRTGYGSTWYGPNEYIQGTLYGETTEYGIVGIYIK